MCQWWRLSCAATAFQAQREQQNWATLTPGSDAKSGSPSLFRSGSCKTADVSKHTMLAQTRVLLSSSRKKNKTKKTKNPDIHMVRVRNRPAARLISLWENQTLASVLLSWSTRGHVSRYCNNSTIHIPLNNKKTSSWCQRTPDMPGITVVVRCLNVPLGSYFYFFGHVCIEVVTINTVWMIKMLPESTFWLLDFLSLCRMNYTLLIVCWDSPSDLALVL